MSKWSFLLKHPSLRSKAYLYDLVREYKPSIAIETGVFAGASTSFILQAMRDNNAGHLYSIDLPNQVQARGGVNLLNGRETGWLVPKNLKDRWTLIIGDSKEKLPPLMNHLNAIDFFHHDSLHSYEHMMFEFKTVWPHLRKGGIISSDDVDKSTFQSAFIELCNNWWLKPILSKTLWGYRGYAVKY